MRLRAYEWLGAACALLALLASAAVVADLGVASTVEVVRLLMRSAVVMGIAVIALLTAPLSLAAALAVRRKPWPLVGVCALLVVATAAVLARYGHLRELLVPAGIAYALLLAATAALAATRTG